MLRILSILLLLVLMVNDLSAFCGFYVAKADAKLFNRSSQVIIARDGNRSVITMASDYQGDLKDFAMVVPVPEVLQRDRIRVITAPIFEKMDTYSGPRLVEYHDENPCFVPRYELESVPGVAAMDGASDDFADFKRDSKKKYGVKIEAKYNIGEYEILILSAKESSGLENWLNDNDYKIPSGANEVLQPYIRNNMKFFVVKVDLEKMKSSGITNLRPIQIAFESEKFMLPIRLGMANADGDQDMIVYVLSSSGRTEVANYRTVKIPTNREIPTFCRERFGEFYKDLFYKNWVREGKNSVFLEYAWDLSVNTFVKCDPCNGPPPVDQELVEAGCHWLKVPMQQRSNGQYWGQGTSGSVFLTRLHVRYNRENFPQDLFFQTTPNKERFQGRYIMRNPAQGDLSCDAGQQYLETLRMRRQKEMQELAYLTGWDLSKHKNYVSEYDHLLKSKLRGEEKPVKPENKVVPEGDSPKAEAGEKDPMPTKTAKVDPPKAPATPAPTKTPTDEGTLPEKSVAKVPEPQHELPTAPAPAPTPSEPAPGGSKAPYLISLLGLAGLLAASFWRKHQRKS